MASDSNVDEASGQEAQHPNAQLNLPPSNLRNNGATPSSSTKKPKYRLPIEPRQRL
ncbi:hypothetical protein CCACVL1_19358 [Corchorus capsularis]|uniref:Uncharacterized protein n=1 Tax=Corchorus capsularis TaxID=210143 RepID=A0A1R3HH68_COCAP|nr:hypothetical protein CCACVL1_19358 [Corchorus capsularis]